VRMLAIHTVAVISVLFGTVALGCHHHHDSGHMSTDSHDTHGASHGRTSAEHHDDGHSVTEHH
jgi:hypothetical protein